MVLASKALSGSVGVFCNWGAGVRWVGFHNKYLMPGGVGLNPDILVSGPLRQRPEAKLRSCVGVKLVLPSASLSTGVP